MELFYVFKVLNFQRTYCVKQARYFYHDEPHHERIFGVCLFTEKVISLRTPKI